MNPRALERDRLLHRLADPQRQEPDRNRGHRGPCAKQRQPRPSRLGRPLCLPIQVPMASGSSFQMAGTTAAAARWPRCSSWTSLLKTPTVTEVVPQVADGIEGVDVQAPLVMSHPFYLYGTQS